MLEYFPGVVSLQPYVTASQRYFYEEFPEHNYDHSTALVFSTQYAQFIVGLSVNLELGMATAAVDAFMQDDLTADALELNKATLTPYEAFVECVKHGLDELYPETMEIYYEESAAADMGMSFKILQVAFEDKAKEQAFYDDLQENMGSIPIDRTKDLTAYVMHNRVKSEIQDVVGVVSAVVTTGHEPDDGLGVPPFWPVAHGFIKELVPK